MKNLIRKRRLQLGQLDWVHVSSLILLAMAILLGGGGADGAFNNGIIYAASMIVIALAIAAHFTGIRPLGSWAIYATLLFLGIFALGIFQLLPVVDGPWLQLEGRATERSLLALLGPDTARPLSLDSEATVRTMAAFLLPFALLLTGLSASRPQLRAYFIVIAFGIAINGIFAVLQIGLGYPQHLSLYANRQLGEATGLFANPNHFGMFLILSILALAVLVLFLRRDEGKKPIRLGGRRFGLKISNQYHGMALLGLAIAIPLFATFMFAADTRAGLFNLLIAVPIAMIAALRLNFSGKLLLVLLAMPVVFGVLIYLNPNLSFATRSGLLFDFQDIRFRIIPDLVYLLESNWSWGIGLGSFESAFMAIENLDLVGPYFINHAHNDWLEWLIETGLAGAVILGFAIIGLLAMAVRAFVFSSSPSRTERFFVMLGLSAVAVAGLHSLVDYPVRMAANAAVLVMFICLLALPWNSARIAHRRLGKVGSISVFAVLLVPAALAAAVIMQTFAAQQAFRDGRSAAAVALRPTHGGALALAAARIDPREGDGAQQAITLGRRALIQRPYSIRAARAVAMALEAEGNELNGFWPYAASLGWRDTQTQGWAFMQALRSGQYDIAAIRADALLRTAKDIGETNDALWQLTVAPEFRAPFIERLRRSPDWRSRWLAAGPPAQEQALEGAQALLTDLLPDSDRYEFSGTVNMLINTGQPLKALDLYRRVWPQQDGVLLDDGGFDYEATDYRGRLTRFDWSLNRGVEGMATAVEGVSDPALFMESDGKARRVLVNRMIGLDQGSYRMSFAIEDTQGETRRLRAAIACFGARSVLAMEEFAAAEDGRLTLDFETPGDCPVVGFSIVADLSEDWISARIDDVTLESRP